MRAWGRNKSSAVVGVPTGRSVEAPTGSVRLRSTGPDIVLVVGHEEREEDEGSEKDEGS